MNDPAVGSALPDFTLTAALPDGGEETVTLSGLRGRFAAVFIYPKDSTSG